MTYHDDHDDHDDDADLAALRATTAARIAAGEDSLARAWERIAAERPVGPPPRRARRLVPAGAAATVAAVALGSVALLGGGDGGEPVPPAGPEFPRITDPSQINFPLDEYVFTDERYAVYLEAMVQLTDECLQRFGAGPEWEIEPMDLPDFDAWYRWRYGVFDLAVANEWGYRPPPDGQPVHVYVDPYELPDRKLDDMVRMLVAGASPGADGWPEEELFLVVGRGLSRFADRPLPDDADGNRLPADGCGGEVRRALSGGLPYPDPPADGDDFWARAEADERVRAADAAWSDCMRRAGFEYGSYADANEWELTYDTVEPTREEIADAVANVECKIETNLVGVLVGVTSELQDAFIQDNWDQLQELKLWLDTVHRNAHRVLAEPAGSS